jgi:hypothetical protein
VSEQKSLRERVEEILRAQWPENETRMALQDALDEQDETEYEYAHWNIPGGYVDDERFETLEGAALEMTAWMKPQNWKIVRRPKPQEWEDVPTG